MHPPPPLLFIIILLSSLPPTAGSIQYVSYQPAVNIIYTSSSNTNSPPPSSPPQQQGGSGGGTVPFSPAIPPNCPTNTQSCSSIGEPSWCCTTAQHCAFDDAGDVACCPVGDFCRGVVEYGTGGAASSSTSNSNGERDGGSDSDSGGSGTASGSGSGSDDTQPADTWNLPGISNGNGGVTITSGANPTHICRTLLPLLLLLPLCYCHGA